MGFNDHPYKTIKLNNKEYSKIVVDNKTVWRKPLIYDIKTYIVNPEDSTDIKSNDAVSDRALNTFSLLYKIGETFSPLFMISDGEIVYLEGTLRYEDIVKYVYDCGKGYELAEDDSKIIKITGITDSTSKYLKIMPENTFSFNILKVEGKSEVSENLAVVNDKAETTLSNFIYKVVNGVFYIKKTVDDSSQNNVILSLVEPITFKANVTYYLNHFCNNNYIGIRFLTSDNTNIVNIDYTINKAYTPTEDIVATKIQWFGSGAYNVELVYKPMVSLTTVTEFSVGYTGIHNFAWTGVKVEGVNLCNILDKSQTTISGVSCQASNNKIKIQGTASASGSVDFPLSVLSSNTYSCSINIINGSQQSSTSPSIYIRNENNSYIDYFAPSRTSFSFTNSVGFIRVAWESGTTINIEFSIMLNYGSTALAYVPYVAPTTTTIDLSSILYNGSPLFEGNSLKAVGTAKDYITPYVAHKDDGAIQIKDCDITNDASNQRFILSVPNLKYGSPRSIVLLCSGYECLSNTEVFDINWNMVIYNGGTQNNTQIFIHNHNYATIEAFINAEGDKYIVFPLATPIEVSIDWSSLLRGIQGYSNGSATLKNTYNMDTSNTMLFKVAGSSSISSNTEYTALNDVYLNIKLRPINYPIIFSTLTHNLLSSYSLYRTVGRASQIQGDTSGVYSGTCYFEDQIEISDIVLHPAYNCSILSMICYLSGPRVSAGYLLIDLDQYISVKTFNLSVTSGTGVQSVVITRTIRNYPSESTTPVAINPGNNVINYGDTITVSATSETGYSMDSYITEYDNITSDISINLTAHVTYGTISVTSGTGVQSVVITCNGTQISSSDTLYYGDELTIISTASTGYKINDNAEEMHYVFQPSTDGETLSFSVTASPKQYTLTLNKDQGIDTSSIDIIRASSPIGGGSTGTLQEGDIVYYQDVLHIYCEANTNYVVGSGYDTSISYIVTVLDPDGYLSASGTIFYYDLTSTYTDVLNIEQYSYEAGVALDNEDLQTIKVDYPDNPSVVADYDPTKRIRVDQKIKIFNNPSYFDRTKFLYIKSYYIFEGDTRIESGSLFQWTTINLEVYPNNQRVVKLLFYPKPITIKLRLISNNCYNVEPEPTNVTLAYYGKYFGTSSNSNSYILADYDYHSSYSSYTTEKSVQKWYKDKIRLSYTAITGWVYDTVTVNYGEQDEYNTDLNTNIVITKDTTIVVKRNILKYTLTVNNKYALFRWVLVNNVYEISNWESPTGLETRTITNVPYGSKMYKSAVPPEKNNPMYSELSTHNNGVLYNITGDTTISNYYYTKLMEAINVYATVTFHKVAGMSNAYYPEIRTEFDNINYKEKDEYGESITYYNYNLKYYYGPTKIYIGAVTDGSYEESIVKTSTYSNYYIYKSASQINSSDFKFYVHITIKGRLLGNVQRTDSTEVVIEATKVVES